MEGESQSWPEGLESRNRREFQIFMCLLARELFSVGGRGGWKLPMTRPRRPVRDRDGLKTGEPFLTTVQYYYYYSFFATYVADD
jgi:hypothetical protein